MKALGKTGITVIVIAAAVLLFGGTCVASYNKLVRLDQAAAAQWAQVENTYQRRADLVPNLVETVKGAAAFERQTITEVTEARSRVGQVTLPKDRSDLGAAGVMFTIDTESGFRDAVLINASYGLGENVVQGSVNASSPSCSTGSRSARTISPSSCSASIATRRSSRTSSTSGTPR